MTVRALVDDFALANPFYIGATVHIYVLDQDLLPTATLAPLYAGRTGGTTLENPQVLDSEGKFEQPVYVGVPVATTVTIGGGGSPISTGDQGLIARWRGVWTTATIYYPGERVRHPTTGLPYTVIAGHTSGAIAADISGGLLQAEDTGATGGVADAPSDGAPYVRRNGAWEKQTETVIVALSDETTAITTGNAKVTIHLPFAFTLTNFVIGLTTVSSSGSVTVDMNEAGSTVLSTKPSIDASEYLSTTGTAAVISDASLAQWAKIEFDIDAAGTGAKGLKVYLIGTRS